MGKAMLDRTLMAFAGAYAEHREAEGRRLADADLLALPWLRHGPQAAQWAVRARTFETFVARVLEPLAGRRGRPLSVVDLGAGNGWLSYRVGCAGHSATAVDIRADRIRRWCPRRQRWWRARAGMPRWRHGGFGTKRLHGPWGPP
jgi:hypothetical protein